MRSIIDKTTFAVRRRNISDAKSTGIICWPSKTERSYRCATFPSITKLRQPSFIWSSSA
jgi:hypothetical protein